MSIAALVLLLASSAPAPTAKTVRLDPAVRPTRVELRLDVDPERDFLLGTADLSVRVPDARSEIVLHGRNLDVSLASVAGQAAIWTQLDDEGTAALRTARGFGPGVVTVHVEWRAKLGAQLEGVYATAFEGRRYLSTQFESINARDAFPCFDEPGFKAPVALTLFVDEGDTAVANAPEVAFANTPDGRKRVTFATTQPLPAYLIAFAVGPYEIVDGPLVAPFGTRKDALPIRAVVPRGQGGKVRDALALHADVVRVLERYTGQAYPYGKLDFVAVPEFAWGGMENAGLIVYKDSRITIDPAQPASVEKQKGMLGLIAHETAHQWFGDLVTMAWWDDVWLNEAFATWAAYKVVEELRPEFTPRANMRSYSENVLGQDSLLSARQIRQRIESKADILDAFDGISYGKGASVIRMFEGYVGRPRWQAGIRAYLAEHRHGNATARDLVDAVSRNARVDIASAFFTFLEQPGAPLVDATLACDGGTPRLVLAQTRYLPIGSTPTPAQAAQSWALPVCAIVDGKEMCTLLRDKTGALDLGPGCPKHVVMDAGARGYFRWALPASLMQPLVDGSVKLSAEERIGVGGSIRAGFANARLSYQEALALALPLANDDNAYVAQTPIGILWFARDFVADDKMRAKVTKKMADAYAPTIKRLGVMPKEGESPEVRELRIGALRALVHGAEDKETIAELAPIARARFGADVGIMQRDKAPPDLTDVLGAALVASDAKIVDALIARLATTEDSEDRRDLLGALGAVRDAKVAAKLVELSLGPTLRTDERLTLLGAMGADPRTRAVAIAYVKAHADELLAVVPEQRRGGVPRVLGSGCTDADAREVEQLFRAEGRAEKFGLTRPIAQTAEGIRLCAAKKSAHEKSARAFFK